MDTVTTDLNEIFFLDYTYFQNQLLPNKTVRINHSLLKNPLRQTPKVYSQNISGQHINFLRQGMTNG